MDREDLVGLIADTPADDVMWDGLDGNKATPNPYFLCNCSMTGCAGLAEVEGGLCEWCAESCAPRVLLDEVVDPSIFPPETFESTFRQIFDETFQLLVDRQRKYGPENVRKLGIFGIFGRLSDDKVERIRRALNGSIVHGEVKLDELTDFADESVEDALKDIANYALILIALKRGVWGRPLAEELQ